MPTYDYRCEACGKTFEFFHAMTANPKKKCPGCKNRKLVRLISKGAGIIFKGEGWYSTSSVEYINAKARDNETGQVGIVGG